MYNKAIIVGRLTHDPEIRTTSNGNEVVTISVAVNGYKEDDVLFIDVTAWKNLAKFISKYFSKGSSILIEGAIKSDTYTDKDNNKRTKIYILASNAHFVEKKQQ